MKPLAILTSDWHVWGKAPANRSLEGDWLIVLGKALARIRALQAKYEIPVLVAGDIFDYHNPSPEVVNWLLDNIPSEVYCVPGQHDLQNHSYALMGKTGYGTLKRAGAITDLDPGRLLITGGGRIALMAMPWGFGIPVGLPETHGYIRILVGHRYIYSNDSNRHRGADEKAHVSGLKGLGKTCDVAVFGDNHRPFEAECDGVKIVNCGTLVSRRADEPPDEAGFWLLHDDLSVKRVHTRSAADLHGGLKEDGKGASPVDMSFMDEMERAADDIPDFREEVERRLENGSKMEIEIANEILTEAGKQ